MLALGAGQSVAIADEGVVVSPPLPAAERQSQSQAVQQYWTKEAMESAIPMSIREMPSPAAEGVIVSPQAEEQPSAPPGLAPACRPGGNCKKAAPQTINPDAQTGGTLLMTSPPFSPPATPTSYSDYAPFNRWTWDGISNYYRKFPVSTVGKLFFTQLGLNYVCSASVINASTLATAGHCIHAGNNSSTGWSSNLLFCPSYYTAGADPARGCWAWTGYAATSGSWYSSGNPDRDYACFVTNPTGTVVANKVGNVTGWLGRAWNWSSRQSTFAWGYPAASPFPGNRIITVASTEWYEVNMNTTESQKSKYIGSDMTGGSSGGPWWFAMRTTGNTEYADTDGSDITDPRPLDGPYLNGVNSHKRCSASGCPAGSVFTQEMGSPQFRSTTADTGESEDVFALCFSNGGA